MSEPENRICLEGTVLPGAETRWTPAGLPLTRFELEHSSRVVIAEMKRVVQCRITVVALGEALSGQAKGLAAGGACRVEGVLGQRVRRWRGEEPMYGRFELHATTLSPLNGPPNEPE
ncbi:primosomal replication protein N [Thiohalorhabdus methylotrophus]|uniref:Primosomal replication protein N n=1 Tax=Thiohalorhabdus methylotrophus TaxID=3242694 RepID=A0ABV4TYD5_9GAMM